MGNDVIPKNINVVQLYHLVDSLRLLRDRFALLLKKTNELRLNWPEDHDRYIVLVDKLEAVLKEFDIMQNESDILIASMTPEQRIYFIKKIPAFFVMVGWHNRIDDNGNIVYDA